MARTTQYYVSLTEEEREYLQRNCSSGTWRPRFVKRASIILKADTARGTSIPEEQIASELNCCVSTVRNIKLRFAKGERLKVIGEKPRLGRPRTIHGDLEAHIIATACSSPPEGRVRWTLHLIADKVVVLTEEPCSHMAVARTLKKMNLSLG